MRITETYIVLEILSNGPSTFERLSKVHRLTDTSLILETGGPKGTILRKITDKEFEDLQKNWK